MENDQPSIMKKGLSLVLFLLFISVNIGNSQMTYSVNSCGYAPIAGVGTPLPNCDDCMSGMIPIGFTFNFYGVNYTQCDVSSNGFLTFNPGMGSGCCSGQLLPSAGWPTMIAWSWDDMYTIGATVNYFTSGVAPNRIFVINYNNVGYCCTSSNMASVQIQLYETTNEIRILSANNNHTGRIATMGIYANGVGAQPYPGRNSTSWATGGNECVQFIPGPPPPPPPPLCYSGGAIAYAPDAVGGATISLSDDQYSPVINIGFSFCLDGTTYTQCLISSNGYVDFDLGSASAYSPYSTTAAIPTTTPTEIMRSILAPWQDLYPPGGGTITYQTLGVAPNRRFVVSWTNMPMFSCTGTLFTGQLKLFETTNCIEIHLGNKQICTGWNGGQAIEGYNNANGSQMWVVPGRNAPTQWAVTNDAVRYAPTCAPCSTALTCIVPLPVELSSSNLTCDEGKVKIQWTTSSEINNDHFIVERSHDGVNYKEISRIPGNGNSNQQQTYQYSDLSPLDGNGYYRLKQVDYNGDFKAYPPMTIYCAPVQISLYPNPTQGEFKIIGATENDPISISNPAGGVLIQTKASGEIHPMNLSHLGSGVYFVTIVHNSNTVVRKLVID